MHSERQTTLRQKLLSPTSDMDEDEANYGIATEEHVEPEPQAVGEKDPYSVTDDTETGLPRVFELPKTYTTREKVRLTIIGIHWQFMILVVCIIDVALLFTQLGEGVSAEDTGIVVMTVIVLFVYSLDIVLRLYAYRPYLFFKKIGNVFDFVVVLASIILQSMEHTTAGAGVGALRGIRAAYRVAIALRVLRTLTVVQRQASGELTRAARNVTGENKKRFVDLGNSFDIDLTYINREIIAMGVPATGFIALYRNPINEVVRFFTLRHEGSYRIYNCCPEHPYPHEKFDNNVRAFDIQDHTPPTMEIMMQFLEDAEAFMAGGGNRVIAVHCRGGKGRTGSLVCAWLLYSGFCRDAPSAMIYFAHARTELRKKSSKLQGVDTPSQKRYITQLDSWLNQIGARQHSGVPLTVPEAKSINLSGLAIKGFFANPMDEASSPLVVAVHQNGAGGGITWILFWNALHPRQSCLVDSNSVLSIMSPCFATLIQTQWICRRTLHAMPHYPCRYRLYRISISPHSPLTQRFKNNDMQSSFVTTQSFILLMSPESKSQTMFHID
eukprot:m.612927 g.612927  ORF g.612927 m.612927 type:complete len:553 (-) comp22500_c2_seq4:674-2332(-)